jgi:VMA21-like domain
LSFCDIYFLSIRFFGPTNRVVTLKLIRFSLWMILFPLGTFFFLFHIVFEKNKDMLGWCGIAAVVAANIVVIQYVVMAWNEDKEEFAQKRREDIASGKIRVD